MTASSSLAYLVQSYVTDSSLFGVCKEWDVQILQAQHFVGKDGAVEYFDHRVEIRIDPLGQAKMDMVRKLGKYAKEMAGQLAKGCHKVNVGSVETDDEIPVMSIVIHVLMDIPASAMDLSKP